MCFFQAPGLQGNQSLCQESQPALLFLPDSSFVVASFGSSSWSLAIKCLHVQQQGSLLLRGRLHLLFLFGNELRFL